MTVQPSSAGSEEAEIGMLREKLSDALAGGLPHRSDCAVYSAPAYEPGPCTCGVGITADDNALDLVRKIREHNGWTRIATEVDAVSLVRSFIAGVKGSSHPGSQQPISDAAGQKEILAYFGPEHAGWYKCWFDDDKYAARGPKPYWVPAEARYLGLIWARKNQPRVWLPMPPAPSVTPTEGK